MLHIQLTRCKYFIFVKDGEAGAAMCFWEQVVCNQCYLIVWLLCAVLMFEGGAPFVINHNMQRINVGYVVRLWLIRKP